MFRFQSRVTGDLIMLEPHGRQLLRILGRTTPEQWERGILEPADMPAALSALEQAAVADEQRRAQAQEQALDEGESAPEEGISLRKRALPLMQMIQRCQQADQAIVWGV